MKHVLLIYPDFFTRVELDDMLAPKGFSVTATKDFGRAYVKLKSQSFQLIVTHIPQAFGMLTGFLSSLRSQRPDLPVVVLTERVTDVQVQELKRFAPLEVVLEPFSLFDLLKRFDFLIRSGGSGVRTKSAG